MATRIRAQRRSMRKAPQQQRSRATVDAIVEAAARILARRGWAGFTTNEVAAVAGVSVGSLYQYFPNKLALAEAIRRRHLDAVLAALSVSGGDDEGLTLERRVARLIDGVVAAHSVNQALHHVLLDEVPLTPRSSQDAFEIEYLQRYQTIVAAGSGRRAGGELAARVLSAAVEGVVHAAARRGELGSPALKAELGKLVSAYLRSRSRPRGG
ncbi:MAG: TetR/AcrR family transcriptional regulator [Rudaea sp.]|uniref:TetR/AcrR family transcriptional regulator n=1 Tax=unclassified Rudaea TaxID=2627037 RepID=UPI0010FA5C4B|nr:MULTISPECIES: TetR/AcrR family transcriptional regulator [unclassified Rudaea]MBN8888614.1 TetR/AcrR family transcriptional regulator [Rudaea sp.]MBR0344385.1 TetR/AcrR family transcriptional regulator [Rudaea sp.]